MRELGQLEGEARREAGQALNALKDTVSAAIENRKTDLPAPRLMNVLPAKK